MRDFKTKYNDYFLQFVKKQIEISVKAEQNVLRLANPYPEISVKKLEDLLKFTNASKIASKIGTLEKDEKLGVRQKRNGENVLVVEDLKGSFKRLY